MNEQQLFDVAYSGLAKQGFEKSQGEYLSCAYRGMGGRKCAIGHAIPDELYSLDMDTRKGDLSKVLNLIGYSGDYGFAIDLQFAHDSAGSPKIMKRNLMIFARRLGLALPNAESES